MYYLMFLSYDPKFTCQVIQGIEKLKRSYCKDKHLKLMFKLHLMPIKIVESRYNFTKGRVISHRCKLFLCRILYEDKCGINCLRNIDQTHP